MQTYYVKGTNSPDLSNPLPFFFFFFFFFFPKLTRIPIALTKKQRARHLKKRSALLAALPKIVPLHEQTIDLTPSPHVPATTTEGSSGSDSATATIHLEKRKEVTKSARRARRKGIEERNYLGGA